MTVHFFPIFSKYIVLVPRIFLIVASSSALSASQGCVLVVLGDGYSLDLELLLRHFRFHDV